MTRPNAAAAVVQKKKKKKRIVIKPFSKPPQLPDNFYVETSQELLQATMRIYASPETKKLESPQNSYTSVVDLVNHQYGPRLYCDLVHGMKQAAECILQTPPTTTTGVLQHVYRQYQQYVEYVLCCRHVFMDLDRTHLWQSSEQTAIKRSDVNQSNTAQSNNNNSSSSNNNNTQTLWQVGLEQFKNRLEELKLDVSAENEFWTTLWDNYKFQNDTDLLLLSQIIGMWQELQLLAHVLNGLSIKLQDALERESNHYWKSTTDGDYDANAFVKHVHSKWTRVSQQWTFLPRTWLRTLIEVKLLEPHLNSEYLLKPQHFDKLPQESIQILWVLAGRLSKNKLVAKAICQSIKTRGQACITSEQNSVVISSSNNSTMIASLLKLHASQVTLVKLLNNPNELVLPLKQVWDEIMNTTPAVAEQLAKYVDVQFRHSKSTLDQNEILQLFCHLQAKDVFEAFYKRDLAKRLLSSKVTSMDAERSMVTLLKAECGAGYTSKMEGMFQDVEWSRETMNRYKSSLQGVPEKTSVDMEVQVLTTGYWPVYPQHPNLILPQELKDLQERFHEYYKSTYQGRRMSWQYALGNVVMKATFGKKRYDLVVSLLQALVLLCFVSEKERWTLPEIQKATGVEDRGDVERLLQSLCLGKDGTRVLRKHDHVEPGSVPSKKKIRQAVFDEDYFTINESFESPLRRIKINNILFKETRQEHEKVVQGISRDRLYLMDAVLVRILKARKTILHQQLIPQVLEQIKVPAQPSDIKKRIESLIEREYMERDKKDRNRYNYLA